MASTRERLRGRFVAAVTTVAEARAPQEPQRALVLLERALLCEPADERLHAQAMRVAIDTGQARTALDLYARCCDALAANGREPSAATLALYDSARSM